MSVSKSHRHCSKIVTAILAWSTLQLTNALGTHVCTGRFLVILINGVLIARAQRFPPVGLMLAIFNLPKGMSLLYFY